MTDQTIVSIESPHLRPTSYSDIQPESPAFPKNSEVNKTDIENSRSQGEDGNTATNTKEGEKHLDTDRSSKLTMDLEEASEGRDNSLLDNVAPLLPPIRSEGIAVKRESVALQAHRQSVSELLLLKGFTLSRDNTRASVVRLSGSRP
jgi:hypothetical protein